MIGKLLTGHKDLNLVKTNIIMGLFNWIFGKRSYRINSKVKIIDPDNLFYRNGQGEGYWRLNEKYKRHQISDYVRGRKVKFWKMVYGADDEDGDEFIPIFYSRRKNSN